MDKGRRNFLGREAGAEREAAADRLRGRDDIRLHAGPFMGEELAGASHAALNFIEKQQQAELVGDGAQAFQELDVGGAHAAFALHRLDQDRGGLRSDLGADLVEIAERHLVEAFDFRSIALQVLLVVGGGERCQGAAVEGALEGDHAIAHRIAEIILIFADQLQLPAFDRFRADQLPKNTASAKVASTRRCASFSCPGMRNRLEQCQTFSACAFAAPSAPGVDGNGRAPSRRCRW